MFGRKGHIHKLCTKSGVEFCFRDGPLHQVRQVGPGREYAVIIVDYRDTDRLTKFTCRLPVRFPLERTPDGLFARAMMRSIHLSWSNWLMDIKESCDAVLYLCSLVPTRVLDADLFGTICREQQREAAAFHQELRDKFNYAGQIGGGHEAASVRRAGVPMRRPDGPPQWIRYVEEHPGGSQR